MCVYFSALVVVCMHSNLFLYACFRSRSVWQVWCGVLSTEAMALAESAVLRSQRTRFSFLPITFLVFRPLWLSTAFTCRYNKRRLSWPRFWRLDFYWTSAATIIRSIALDRGRGCEKEFRKGVFTWWSCRRFVLYTVVSSPQTAIDGCVVLTWNLVTWASGIQRVTCRRCATNAWSHCRLPSAVLPISATHRPLATVVDQFKLAFGEWILLENCMGRIYFVPGINLLAITCLPVRFFFVWFSTLQIIVLHATDDWFLINLWWITSKMFRRGEKGYHTWYNVYLKLKLCKYMYVL